MYYQKGIFCRQAHVDIPEGTVEEEFARRGFFGRTSHLYRSETPLAWTEIDGPLRPEAFDTSLLPGLTSGDYLEGRIPFLTNADVTMSLAMVSETMDYAFRNADGDEVLFVHSGDGEIETDFGPLTYEKGDYLVIPRGTMYRLTPENKTSLLIIESTGEVELPEKGILGQHALFDPAVINVPAPRAAKATEQTTWQLKIKRLNQITTVSYASDPINVVGWKGDLTVWQLNIRDIRPVMSERYHLPPTAHITFLMQNAVICTFLPRGLETGDEGALKVPFFHNNIDFDEVIFYHDGDFFSRAGISPGMVTFHPQGIHHGPQPAAVEASKDKERTNEKAVMVDTRYPLVMTEQAKSISMKDYWKSWMQIPTNEKEKSHV